MNKVLSGRVNYAAVFSIFLTLVFCLNVGAQPQEAKLKLSSESKIARDQSLKMLDEMREILQTHYYDPKFHGIDLEARVEAAKARVKTLQYNWQMHRVLVQLLMDFNDSHTRMLLPPRTDHFDYGFGTQMIGDDCYIVSVEKDSNAASLGIQVGDQIVMLGKFKPTRRDLWKMMYVLYKLDPVDTLDLKVRKPDGAEKSLTIKAKTMSDKEFRSKQKARFELNKETEYKCQEVSKEVMACKLYSFVVERNTIDKMMKQASGYPKLILDLRGNGGGYVVIEQYLLSYFFDREVKIADLVTRKKAETRMTKPIADRQYKGEVAVLVDSNSASAAEMTARVLQIEKRAKIYGDISSGSVMTSISVPFMSVMTMLMDAAVIRTGMSVTVADVVMRDGSLLENTGVMPDELLRPSAIGLVQQTDPVLAYAAIKLGATLTPEKAGSFHFMTEKLSDDGDDNAGDK